MQILQQPVNACQVYNTLAYFYRACTRKWEKIIFIYKGPWPLMGMDRQKVYSRNVNLIISPNHFWQKTAKMAWPLGYLVNEGPKQSSF